MAAPDEEHTIHLTLAGELRSATCGDAVRGLRDAIEELPDRLVVDLGQVTAIDKVAISILLAGYLAASDAGIRYQVVNARRRVLRCLVAAGVAQVLADSDDVGALVDAITRPPDPSQPSPPDVRHPRRPRDIRHRHGTGPAAIGRDASGAAGPLRWHRLLPHPAPQGRRRRGVTLRCRAGDRR